MFKITSKYAETKTTFDGLEEVLATHVRLERQEPYTVLTVRLKGDKRDLDDYALTRLALDEVYKRDFADKYQNEMIDKIKFEVEELKEDKELDQIVETLSTVEESQKTTQLAMMEMMEMVMQAMAPPMPPVEEPEEDGPAPDKEEPSTEEQEDAGEQDEVTDDDKQAEADVDDSDATKGGD